MQDRTRYARLLGIEDPWRVTEVTPLLDEEQAVVVSVGMGPEALLLCPKCRGQGSRYDSRERRWRHLDTMQYRTILVADVPRVQCDEHGVVQIAVPWSDPKSRFTALFIDFAFVVTHCDGRDTSRRSHPARGMHASRRSAPH